MRSCLLLYPLLLILQCAAFAQDASSTVEGAAIDKLLLNSRFQEAIDLIDSRTRHSPSPLLEIKRAEALIHLGSFQEASASLESFKTHDLSPLLEAIAESVTAFLHLKLGQYDLAESSLQNALAHFERGGKAATSEAAQAIAALGSLQMSQGKYSEAQEQLHRALSIREQLKENREEWMAATYNDLGLVYSQTDKERALEYYRKAAALYTTLYGTRDVKVALVNINVGIIYRDLKLFQDATSSFLKALDVLNIFYKDAHPTKGIALYNLGQTSVSMNDLTVAMEYYNAALEMYMGFYGGEHPEIASVLTAIADVDAARSDFTNALTTYQKAIHANIPGYINPDVRSNPPLRNYYNGLGLLNTLASKAEAYASRYARKSLKFSDLQDALNVLVVCDSLIDQLRQQSSNETDKLRLGMVASEVYRLGVSTAFQASMNAVRKQPFLEKAFFFAEKSKGAVLLEAVAEASARTYAGISPDLLDNEKKLRSELAANARKLADKPVPAEELSLREESYDLKRQYNAFVRNLEAEYPDYYNLKFNSSVPSVVQLQNLLDRNTALISYFIDERSNSLYIFTIRKRAFKVWQRPLTDDFDKYITGLRNGLYFREINTFKKSAYNLGRTLLPPMPKEIADLIIVPSGRLSIIPFETLLDNYASDDTPYSDLPYLLRRYAVRYEFSTGMLFHKVNKPPQQKNSSAFLCAPVKFPDTPELKELPGSEQEVRSIATIFARNNLPASVKMFREADESFIKSPALKSFNFIHLATHGVVDEVHPELSRVFFRSETEGEDGSVYTGEIFNLELDADLVALSACQTGMGKVMRGEGVIGLSRALFYAGARNVLVSFWSVADESTATLMTRFYENTLDESALSHSHSLRKAKLEFLRDERFSAPFYWAPFILIGF